MLGVEVGVDDVRDEEVAARVHRAARLLHGWQPAYGQRNVVVEARDLGVRRCPSHSAAGVDDQPGLGRAVEPLLHDCAQRQNMVWAPLAAELRVALLRRFPADEVPQVAQTRNLLVDDVDILIDRVVWSVDAWRDASRRSASICVSRGSSSSPNDRA